MKNVNTYNGLTYIAVSLLHLLLIIGLTACSSGGGGGTPIVTVDDVSIKEGNNSTTNLEFTLTLSSAVGSGATVQYATSDGSAIAGSDYTNMSGTLEFSSGSRFATITVPVTGDTDIENDESLVLTLSAASGVNLGAETLSATATISDDDQGRFYEGMATINVPSGTDLTISSPDMKALVHSTGFVIASTDNELLYVGNFSDYTGNNYTATVSVYQGGYMIASASAEGSIISGSSMTGVLSGLGDYASGEYTLTYSQVNDRAAPQHLYEVWGTTSVVDVPFNTPSEVDIGLSSSISPNELNDCDSYSNNLFDLNVDDIGRIHEFVSSPMTTCASGASDGEIFNTYLVLYDEISTDDRMLMVMYNNNYAFVSNMSFIGFY